MNLADITTKCYILALIIRDDGERLLLGDGAYEFKDSQQHFIANTYANDVVELQGTDGQMLAGQVRRTATQTFAGYIGDATFSKQKVEEARRDFLMFFRKKHYYTAVYVFSDGTAIQRDRGYIVNAPSVPELYQRYPEWSVGLNFEDPNYYEYAEDDLGQEIAAHKVELELSTAMSGGLIWDGDGAVSDDLSYVGTEIPGEGKNFQLADTGIATLKSAELLGDAEQTTYSGKNLLNINATPSTLNATSSVSGQAITVTTNSNATTGRVLLPIAYEANRQITVSFDAKMVQNDAGSGLISTVGLRTPDGSDTAGNVIISNTIGQTNHYRATVTLDNNTRWLWLYAKATSVAGVVKVEYSNIQIEYSSSETAYEPYVGGTASPNPDYPQPISVVTGENTVNITGKNLAKIDDNTVTSNGLTYTLLSDGTISISGTSTATSSANATADYPINLVAGQIYTLSLNNPTVNASVTLRFARSVGGVLPETTAAAVDRTFTFTATNTESATLQVRIASGVTLNNFILKPQLELGSTATAYEPYQGQEFPIDLGSIELAKIGTYQDRIYKDEGKWYLEKQVGKVEVAISYMVDALGLKGGVFAIANKKSGTYGALCDKATRIISPTSATVFDGSFYENPANFIFLGSASDDLTSLRTKFNGAILYYALATPTTTEITNSELVGQLERLQHARTYADLTNFSITATSPNLPAFLKVVAFGEDAIPQGGYVWEDGGTGGATTITVDGVDNAQPIWTVVGPATNPSLTNITTGESIQWTGVVPNGQTLVVNMADMTASLSGANVFEFISGSWITLQAGNNRVSYSATAATGIATLEWNGVVG